MRKPVCRFCGTRMREQEAGLVCPVCDHKEDVIVLLDDQEPLEDVAALRRRLNAVTQENARLRAEMERLQEMHAAR